jgi:shikimate kinase
MNNIVFSGFMGTGKSTVGRIVADRLGLTFIDTDDQIIARAGKSIADIFAQDGETVFRQIEADVCQALAAGTNHVIATGGGALLNPHTYEAFAATSLVICLTCNLDTIIQRVGDMPGRPLFAPDRERLATLLESRVDHYGRIPHQINTTTLNPEQVAQEVIRLWQS